MPTRDDLGFTQPDDMWEGMTDPDGNLIEPPEGDTTAVTRSERAAVDVSEFWSARPVLAHLHNYARSQRVGPWAVLGTALARIICATAPQVQLPPTIGSFASLNLFVGLVGYSGDGKDAAQDVAADALYIENENFKISPLGSGEGLAHMFMRVSKVTKENPHPDPEQYNRSALVTVGEIDTLGALVQRQSSTVTAQLRQAAMGQPLGFFYADSTRRMIVPAHEYRLCLVAGVQPEKSGILLNDAAGGTPQRFVWLPAGDPGAQYEVPDPPTPMIWQPPDWAFAQAQHARGKPRWVLTLPEIVKHTIVEARVNRLRGEGERLDSHAILTRVKVAAALAVLDGRITIEPPDWDLSGVVMAVSDSQRARCLRVLALEREKGNKAKALEEADRSMVVEERIDREMVRKCGDMIRLKLLENGSEWMSGGVLRTKIHKKLRPYWDAAVDSLANRGQIETQKTEYRGQPGVSYRAKI